MSARSAHGSIKPKPMLPPDDDLFAPAPVRKWKRRLIIAGVVFLLLLVVAEWFASAMISAKLRAMVGGKLDAELKLGPVIYVPPYGAIVFSPQLVRGPETLFRAARIKLSLAKLPAKNQPLIISSLRMSSPMLSGYPGAFSHMAKPSAQQMAPQKLSEMLRLDDVHLFDGKIQWRASAGGNEQPMSFEGLAMDVDTTQQSPSTYTFHLVSRAQLSADVSATGDIDVDSLDLMLRNLSVKVRVEPDPTRSPFPAVVQQWMKNYAINGSLSIVGNGNFPLREMKQSAFRATVQLENGSGDAASAHLAVDQAGADLVAEKKTGGPVVVRLNAIDLASGSKSISIKKGQLVLDVDAGRWSLSDLDGQLLMEKPRGDALPTTAPAPKWEKFQPAGRADFTAVASAPFKFTGKPWEAIDHTIIIYPRGALFLPKDFAHRMEDIGGGEIRIKGGMIVFQELNAKYGGDSIRLRSARLPLDGLPDLQRWQEISASVAFHQPIRRYAPVLDRYFDTLNPDGNFLFAGSWTVDKRGPDSKSDFDLIVSTDRGSFDLSSHHIPLNKIRGDMTITPAGVQLHGLEAELLTGRATLTGQWSKASENGGNFEGDLTMNAVDLGKLADVSDNPPDVNLHGKLAGQATFSGTTNSEDVHLDWTKALRASGECEITNGDFFKLPVLRDIFQRIHGLQNAATVGDAAALFDVMDEKVILRDAAVNAPALGLQGGGRIAFNGTIDAGVVAAPLADWRNKLKETKIPIISDVAGEVAGAVQKLLNNATGTLLYQFRVTGNLHDKVEVNAVAAPILTESAATVFGRMLNPSKEKHPLDWFERNGVGPRPK